jgi:hypothetical protein
VGSRRCGSDDGDQESDGDGGYESHAPEPNRAVGSTLTPRAIRRQADLCAILHV